MFNKLCWQNWTATCKNMGLDLFLTPCTKVRSKWIKDLNIRPESIRYMEDKVCKTLHDIEAKGIFKHDTPLAKQVKTEVNKWDCLKLRSFCTSKKTVTKIQRQSTEWERIFTQYPSDKGLISRIYKALVGLYKKKTSNPIRKCGEEMNRNFPTEEIRMAKRHM